MSTSIGFGSQDGMGLYATNWRLIGFPTDKGWVGFMGVAGIILAADRSPKLSVEKLDSLKRVEIWKDGITSLQMKRPDTHLHVSSPLSPARIPWMGFLAVTWEANGKPRSTVFKFSFGPGEGSTFDHVRDVLRQFYPGRVIDLTTSAAVPPGQVPAV